MKKFYAAAFIAGLCLAPVAAHADDGSTSPSTMSVIMAWLGGMVTNGINDGTGI